MLARSISKRSVRYISLGKGKNGRHDGRVAVLTASTSGIGLHAAKRLGHEGAKIAICSRKQENVDQALAELKSEGIEAFGKVCHVSNSDQRKAFMAETAELFGGIDYLFSNAGVNPYTSNFLSTSEEVFDKVFDVNVKGMFLVVQDAFEYMKNRPNSSIILHSSAVAYTPHIYPGAYSASKTGILGIMHALTPELGKENIRINTLAPTSTRTKFGSAILDNPKFWDVVKSFTPLEKPCTVDATSAAISFMFSDQAKYVTGETFPLAGATWLRL